MANGWTLERRARQRELIQKWQPWKQSTGPRTLKGKAVAADNAIKHGLRSRPHLEMMRKFRKLLKEQNEARLRVQPE